QGRPLKDITHSLNDESILDDLKQLFNGADNIKKVVSDTNGGWYFMRLYPYGENGIEGAVITFIEFTELEKTSAPVKQERYQETLATLGIYALEKDELEMVMHRVLQQSCLNLQLECAFVAKLNQEENTFEVIAEVGCDCKDMTIENDVKWDLGYALQKETPVSVADHREETRFAIAPFMADKHFKCSAYTAIRGTEDIHGVYCIFADERRKFDRQDLQFIQVAANIIGMAIEQKKTK